MLHDNEQFREPENMFDALYVLAIILHFYSEELAQLLTGLCIDLAELSATLCRQLGEHIAAGASCFVELLLEPTPKDDWERVADCDPIRVPAVLLLAGGTCMVFSALVLLFWWEWECIGNISPFQAVINALLALPPLIVAHYASEEMTPLWHAPHELQRHRDAPARFASDSEQGRD